MTFLEPEERAYNGGVRKGKAILVKNPHNPIELPYGAVRSVRAGMADTYFTVPATLRVRGRRVKGYLTHDESDYHFTPEADPDACVHCGPGQGCAWSPAWKESVS